MFCISERIKNANTGAVLGELLGEVEELAQELGSFLDDLVTLGRAQKCQLPEADVREMRADLHELRQLRGELAVLFTAETRRRCGVGAVPLLAAALCNAWNWVELPGDWLECVDRLRIRADALRGRLSRHRRLDRHRARRRSEAAGTPPAGALVVQ